jgi:hypothetical protein
VEDLEGLSKEEKLEIADEADRYAERLAAKADSAEKFATGGVVNFLFFLKPGAEKQAARSREVADLAAVAAVKVRAAANGGGSSGALVAGLATLLIAAGGAAVVVGGNVDFSAMSSNSGGDSATKVKISRANPRAKAPSPVFGGQSKAAPKLRDIEAMEAMEKVARGEGDAMSLYDAMRR